MDGYRKVLPRLITLCAAAYFVPASALEKAEWHGGVQMGYALGQNGQNWTESVQDPLANNNRGGFYISQLRAQGILPIDSTFSAFITGNLMFMDLQEAYLQKRWGAYELTAGKFRGAGLKTATAEDEFSRTTIQTPRYARDWSYYKRLINFRDFGVQLEKDSYGGNLKQRLYFHNANRENVTPTEPSFPSGPATQVLGIDYALDWKVSEYSTTGGHVGAVADRQWSEFVGNHSGWEVGYWFKSNPILDFSFYHQMDFTKLHLLNEAMLLYNRTLQTPPDNRPVKTWGVSSMLRFDHNKRISSFFRYEFFDNTDGYNPDDALHLITVGGIYRPAPDRYSGLQFTGEYVRTLEEGGQNLTPNDVLYAQMQLVF